MKQETQQSNEYDSSRASSERLWAPEQMSVDELTERLEAGIGKSLRVGKKEFDYKAEEFYFKSVLGSLKEGEHTAYYYIPSLILHLDTYSGDSLFEEEFGSMVRQILDRPDIKDWVDKKLTSSDYSPRILSLDECISDIDGSFEVGSMVNHNVGSLDSYGVDGLRAGLILDRSSGNEQNVLNRLGDVYNNFSTYALNCLRWNVSAPERDSDEWSTLDDNMKSWTANNAHVGYRVLQKLGVDPSLLQQEKSLLQEMETITARRMYE
jgi:hypothetical protein